MKNVLYALMLISLPAMAQQPNALGGCVYEGEIINISATKGGPYETTLQDGLPYTVEVLLDEQMQTCGGTIMIKIGETLVGSLHGAHYGHYHIYPSIFFTCLPDIIS
jgi:hypothetical protein